MLLKLGWSSRIGIGISSGEVPTLEIRLQAIFGTQELLKILIGGLGLNRGLKSAMYVWSERFSKLYRSINT